jgi:hypothetical protein
MDFTVDLIFPAGLAVLGTILTLFKWNTKTALARIKKNNRR